MQLQSSAPKRYVPFWLRTFEPHRLIRDGYASSAFGVIYLQSGGWESNPQQLAWKASTLPLSYRRGGRRYSTPAGGVCKTGHGRRRRMPAADASDWNTRAAHPVERNCRTAHKMWCPAAGREGPNVTRRRRRTPSEPCASPWRATRGSRANGRAASTAGRKRLCSSPLTVGSVGRGVGGREAKRRRGSGPEES